MVARIGIFVCLLIAFSGLAQEQYIRPGLLAASSTFSPSTMLNRNEQNFYITGFAEYFLDTKFSFRSDTYLFLNSQNDQPTIKDGLRSYFGIAYHFNKGNWDGHLGFQPGVTYMNMKETTTTSTLLPSVALRIGTSYYVWKYFHFFANLTYTKSKLRDYNRGNIQTDELIFSAGLGFQIQTKQRY